jgi:FkbM family methyltransferase
MNEIIAQLLRRGPLEFLYRYAKKYRLRAGEKPPSPHLMNFYSRWISSGDLVFDVGANHGDWCKVFRRLGATTIAFEPQANCVEYLKSYFWGDRKLKIENLALGTVEGREVMKMSKNTVLSTLSGTYLANTVKSGRFSLDSWAGEQEVDVTTLDNQIAKHGRPKFIKIDVEGFEAEVICGLSTAVEMVSLEFSRENLDNLLKALQHINSLGCYVFQFSPEEWFQITSEGWTDLVGIQNQLNKFSGLEWGDVYCHLKNSYDHSII